MTAVMSPKAIILAGIELAVLTEAKFTAFDGVLTAKLKEPTLPPRTPDLKEQLDRIYGLYRAAIQSCQQSLRTQYDLGKKVIEAVGKTDDLMEIGTLFTQYQTAMEAAIETHKALEAQIREYETQMIPLLPPNTRFKRG